MRPLRGGPDEADRCSRRFRSIVVASSILLLAVAAAPGTWADEGELGIQIGAIVPDEPLTGESLGLDQAEVAFGLRGGVIFSKHWGWFVDSWFSEVDSAIDDTSVLAARTGFELYFGATEKRNRFFLSLGGGLTQYDPKNGEKVDRAFGSLGFGQRVTLVEQVYFRWELRGDHTLDDDGFGGEALTTPQLLVGLSWGIGGRKDTDGDGVFDKKDDCPDTPFDSRVDERGCAIDSDRDGVPDGLDACPHTIVGWPVDDVGCPLDTDGDGVEDGRDNCPGTPNGAEVDEHGCPKDTDGDGVYDGIDACPRTPRGAQVDARGCPKDTDGDGVFDGLDRCPGTPRGAKVDASGCEIKKKARIVTPERPVLVLEDAFFAWDSDMLEDSSLTSLDRVAKSLVEWPDIRVEVGGHTDSSGDETYNEWLSKQRATTVKNYLVSKGVAESRLTVHGYGPSQPRAENTTNEGRARNRRVELKLVE